MGPLEEWIVAPKAKPKHKVLRFRDVYYVSDGKLPALPVNLVPETSLSKKLRTFARFGIRVLDFWRENGKWAAKVMNRR